MSSLRSSVGLHPIHTLITCTLLLTICLLLGRQSTPYATHLYPTPTFSSSNSGSSDLTLEQRLERSEKLFSTAVQRRRELQDKFGADPVPYPPDVKPHPAYTWWDFVYPSFNCPHEVERIGAVGDGGKWVCGLSRIANKPDCVIYSFGINYESSFEAEMLERTECQVFGYDFSVNNFGPEISARSELVPRAHFHAYGLAGKDSHGPGDVPPMYTLESLMQMNGHTFIDVLKIDIETYEFETLKDLLKEYEGRALPFGQLQIEIHAWKSHFQKTSQLMTWWTSLEKAGLRPFMNEANLVYYNYNHNKPELQEYSFINVMGKHALISD